MHDQMMHYSSTVRKLYAILRSYSSYIGVENRSDSGHGGQTKDLDGDEADGFDEVIYPVDHKTNGHIVDDVSTTSTLSMVLIPIHMVTLDYPRHHGQTTPCWLPPNRDLRRALSF